MITTDVLIQHPLLHAESTLIAADGHTQATGGQINGPGKTEIDAESSCQAHGTRCEFFHSKFVIIIGSGGKGSLVRTALGNGDQHVLAFSGNALVRHAADRFHFRIAGHPQQRINKVNAQITEGASKIMLLHVEHAPGRNAIAADERHVAEVRGADLAAGDDVLGKFHIAAPTHGLAGNQKTIALLGNGKHFFRIGNGNRHGLFAQDVSTGTESGNTPLLMIHVRRTDADNIWMNLIQHFLRIRIPGGNIISRGGFLGGFRANVGAGDQLHQTLPAQIIDGGNMRRIGDHAGSDNGNTGGFFTKQGHGSFLLGIKFKSIRFCRSKWSAAHRP